MVFDYVCTHITMYVRICMYAYMYVCYLTTFSYVVSFSHPGDFHIRSQISPLFWEIFHPKYKEVIMPTGSGAHITSYSVGTGFLLWVKWPGHKVNHSATFSAEVKNE